jgi:transcriptional antiterminator RfaH
MSVFEKTIDKLGSGGAEGSLMPAAIAASTDDGEANAWYCARTKPKHEHIVAAGLKRNLGLEVFHPCLRMERSTRRGMVRVIEPLFPCYVFVRCDIDESLHSVRYVNGVSCLVHFGQCIPVIPEDVIDELKQCFDSRETAAVQGQFREGSEVTVREGAFHGFNGIVLRVLPAKQRVQILLDFLGRTTLAEVDRRSLISENRTLADMMPALSISR